MTPLLLIGGGGHCRSCIDVIEAKNEYKIAGIIVSNTSGLDLVQGYPVIGVNEDLEKIIPKTPNSLVTVGQIKTPDIRIHLYKELKKLKAKLPTIIAPTAYCSKHALVGSGTILMHGALVNASVKIGENCIINSQALVEHDVHIESHCHISTGVRINGGVHIGMGSFIGSGAIIREGVHIGSRAVIGAGQVVLRNVSEGKMVK